LLQNAAPGGLAVYQLDAAEGVAVAGTRGFRYQLDTWYAAMALFDQISQFMTAST